MINRRTILKGAVSCFAVASASNVFANPFQTLDFKISNEKRYAMLINLKRFNNKPDLVEKVVDACHIAHKAPTFLMENSKIQEFKLIWQANENLDDLSSTKKIDFLATCNQCTNAPCVRLCPSGASYRNNQGTISIDSAKCIACKICVAACPYGAVSFNTNIENAKYQNSKNNRSLAVAQKCDFCADRISCGLVPFCVEASDGAIIFGDVNDPKSEISLTIATHNVVQNKASFGTKPNIFYMT